MATDGLNHYPAFVNDSEGYACFRIPSLVQMGNGDLLAVAEGRVHNCGDHNGVIRVVGKISEDNGHTWGLVFVIADNVIPDGSEHVAQNSAPMIDMMDPAHPQGKVIIMFDKAEFGENTIVDGTGVRRACTIESYDHGRTWTNETDITAQVHKPLNPTYTAIYTDAATRYNNPEDWRMTVTPVGHAIQLRGGVENHAATRGRLYASSNLTIGDTRTIEGYNYAVWSDDHGATWEIGGISPIVGINESMAVELETGDVMINFRNNTHKFALPAKVRGVMVHTFDESGAIIMATSHKNDRALPEPTIQGSIHRYSWSDDSDLGSRSRILFSCPSSQIARQKMTVRLSYDDGKTWPVHKVIDDGAAAYGDLAILSNNHIGLLYEQGNSGGIVFAEFALAWLTDGADSI